MAAVRGLRVSVKAEAPAGPALGLPSPEAGLDRGEPEPTHNKYCVQCVIITVLGIQILVMMMFCVLAVLSIFMDIFQ